MKLVVFCSILLFLSVAWADSIDRVEYFIDTDPGLGLSTNILIQPDSIIDVNFSINTTSLSDGSHTVYYRVRNSFGHWSMLHSKSIYKYAIYEPLPPEALRTTLSKLEYFIDTDPGIGLGTNIPIIADSLIDTNFIIDTTPLSFGSHIVYFRLKNNLGNWSMLHNKSIFKYGIYEQLPPESSGTNIVKLEYIIDIDPGLGLGTDVPILPDSLIDTNISIDTSPLSDGPHTVYYRMKDNLGHWSMRHSKGIFKYAPYENIPIQQQAQISQIQWYITGDYPHSDSTFSFTDFDNEYNLDQSIAFSVMDLQLLVPYTLHLYVVDSNGHKSQTISKGFVVDRRPQNFRYETENGLMHIIWDPVPGATGYKVYASATPNADFIETNDGELNGNVWTFQVIDLKKFFQVKSVKEAITK
jgi:hypothetical protein